MSTIEAVHARQTPGTAARCCFLLHVRTDRLDAYLEAHQHVWPEMQRALSDAGWRNYSLFLQKPTGMVVGYDIAGVSGLSDQRYVAFGGLSVAQTFIPKSRSIHSRPGYLSNPQTRWQIKPVATDSPVMLTAVTRPLKMEFSPHTSLKCLGS